MMVSIYSHFHGIATPQQDASLVYWMSWPQIGLPPRLFLSHARLSQLYRLTIIIDCHNNDYHGIAKTVASIAWHWGIFGYLVGDNVYPRFITFHHFWTSLAARRTNDIGTAYRPVKFHSRFPRHNEVVGDGLLPIVGLEYNMALKVTIGISLLLWSHATLKPSIWLIWGYWSQYFRLPRNKYEYIECHLMDRHA